MKKGWGVLTIAATAGALLGTSERAVAQTGFNGTITFLLHSENSASTPTGMPAMPGMRSKSPSTSPNGRDLTLIQTTSGNKLRFEAYDSAKGPNQSGAIIMDGDAKNVTILMPGQKYLTETQDQMKQMSAMGAMNQSATGAPAQPWTITKTGRSETVAGVSCDIYHVSGTMRGKPGEGDVCIAQGVGFAMDQSYGGMMGRNSANTPDMSQLSDLLKGGKGVLKVTEIKNGQSQVVLEAIKIDRTPPPSSAFAPPSGYTQMQMPQMPAGFKMPAGMTPPAGAKPPG